MDWISLGARPRALVLVLLVGVVSAATRAAEGDDTGVRIARLIRELGDKDFRKRQSANEQLERLGHASREQLQSALDDPDVELRLRAKQLLDRLKLDDLWSPSIVDTKAAGEPASKVLVALAAQSGNHIHIGEPYGRFADAPLEANYSQMTYWEAVDDICARTGNRIRPHYDTHTPGIVISAGTPPKYPLAYGGPVRGQITGARRVFIEEVNYEENKSELTHSFQINLRFTWEDRFGIVGYCNQPELIEAVTDGKVVVSSAQPAGGAWSATAGGMRQVTASLKLNPVPISAKQFDVFRIRWGLVAVGEQTVLAIEDLDPTRLHAQDDVSVRVESIEKQPGEKYVVTLDVARDLLHTKPQELAFQEYEVDVLDAEGHALRLKSQSHTLGESGVQLKLTYGGDASTGEPKRLRLHYPRLRARRDVELVFRNVPLPVGKPE